MRTPRRQRFDEELPVVRGKFVDATARNRVRPEAWCTSSRDMTPKIVGTRLKDRRARRQVWSSFSVDQTGGRFALVQPPGAINNSRAVAPKPLCAAHCCRCRAASRAPRFVPPLRYDFLGNWGQHTLCKSCTQNRWQGNACAT